MVPHDSDERRPERETVVRASLSGTLFIAATLLRRTYKIRDLHSPLSPVDLQDKRMFTVRELARSQGFPDWFTFVVEKDVAQDRIVKTVSGF